VSGWLVALMVLAAPAASSNPTPVLVELFTSEGCSSCPPADEALAALARAQPIAGAQIVPLELHVDYWNSLGWTDPFSLKEATARQERYAAASARAGYEPQLYTPEMVVDGTRSFVGNAEMARAAVTEAVGQPKRLLHVDVRTAPDGLDVELHVGPDGETSAALWVALTESGLSSQVTRGENRGRTLVHAPVVRALHQVAVVPGGGWTGRVHLPLLEGWRRQALRVVAFVQARPAGRVSGVATSGVPPGEGSAASSAVR